MLLKLFDTCSVLLKHSQFSVFSVSVELQTRKLMRIYKYKETNTKNNNNINNIKINSSIYIRKEANLIYFNVEQTTIIELQLRRL